MSDKKFVVYNHSPMHNPSTEAMVDALRDSGFEVIETTDSRVALELVEKRTDIGFVLTDEEGLKISGTGLVQRIMGRNIKVPTAVLAHKDIPRSRVPVSFRRPVDPYKVAEHVKQKFELPTAAPTKAA